MIIAAHVQQKVLPAALDITVTSPLNPAILDESCSTAAVAAESRKHVANDPKCFELGWTCVPLAVETYGNWGVEAQETFSRLALYLLQATMCQNQRQQLTFMVA